MSATNGTASDDEMDWEEVGATDDAHKLGEVVIEFQDPDPSVASVAGASTGKKKVAGRRLDEAEKARLNAERLGRLSSHKIHTVALLANASIRNDWLNDELLQARLLSLVPLAIQNHFAMITKKSQPNKAIRGRQFQSAMENLVKWWTGHFEVDDDAGGVRSRTFADVMETIRKKEEVQKNKLKGKGKQKAAPSDDEDSEGEVIRSPKSLMKHALMMSGSRDTSAQLFTALCRALSIPSRLVVSLQPVPWKASVGKPAAKKVKLDPKGKGKAVEHQQDDDIDSFEEVVIPATSVTLKKGKGKANGTFPGKGSSLKSSTPSASGPSTPSRPPVTLRRAKPTGRRLGGQPSVKAYDGPPPPIFWAEVFSRPDGRWMSVDPLRGYVDKRKRFEPLPSDRRNRMLYVVAFENERYAKDVTRRYAKEYNTKIAKLQLREWWDGVMALVDRPFRLNRDDIEDAELASFQLVEPMPTSMAGFKAHPLYVLAAHLRQNQVIHPEVVIGHFHGTPVFSRENVVEVKTAENWMRSEGREVKPGEQPLKSAKVRAVTVERRRAVEMAKENQGGEVTQGLYARWQTKTYEPPPVIDGVVPKNDFGNIDLYTPSMLPQGGVHLPYKGIAKVARKLGIDHAEAVTGFEFKQRRALPILTGVVVAVEQQEPLLEAYWATTQAEEAKERQKKQERVFKRWKKIINGLRIRERLMKEYSVNKTNGEQKVPEADSQFEPPEEGGGFLLGRGEIDVVQRYALPKMQHPIVEHAVVTPKSAMDDLTIDDDDGPTVLEELQDDDDETFGAPVPDHSEAEDRDTIRGKIKTMDELAVAAELSSEGSVAEAESPPPPKKLLPAPRALRSRPSITTSRRSSAVSTPVQSAPRGRQVSTRSKRRKSSLTPEESEAADSESSDEAQTRKRRSAPKRPRKMPRKETNSKVGTPATPASTGRTLRARKSKTVEQLEREKEQEEAYRMAVDDEISSDE